MKFRAESSNRILEKPDSPGIKTGHVLGCQMRPMRRSGSMLEFSIIQKTKFLGRNSLGYLSEANWPIAINSSLQGILEGA